MLYGRRTVEITTIVLLSLLTFRLLWRPPLYIRGSRRPPIARPTSKSSSWKNFSATTTTAIISHEEDAGDENWRRSFYSITLGVIDSLGINKAYKGLGSAAFPNLYVNIRFNRGCCCCYMSKSRHWTYHFLFDIISCLSPDIGHIIFYLI
jgi:hypothetical protein